MAENSSLSNKSKAEIKTRYSVAVDGYKARLVKSPNFPLNVYCDEIGVSYRGMKSWMLARGLRVRVLQAEASGIKTSESVLSSADSFIQIKPAPQTRPTGRWDLHGVSITFTDGVNLTLQECSTESVISLLSIYQNRKLGGRGDVQP